MITLKIVFGSLAAIALIGFALPYLFSQRSYEAVGLGLLVVVIAVTAIGIFLEGKFKKINGDKK